MCGEKSQHQQQCQSDLQGCLLFVIQVPQSDHSILQGRHGIPADVWSDQPAEFPQRQKLDEWVGLSYGLEMRLI